MFFKFKIGKPECELFFFYKIALFDVETRIFLLPVGQLLGELALKVAERAALIVDLQTNGNKESKHYWIIQTGNSGGGGACSSRGSRIFSSRSASAASNCRIFSSRSTSVASSRQICSSRLSSSPFCRSFSSLLLLSAARYQLILAFKAFVDIVNKLQAYDSQSNYTNASEHLPQRRLVAYTYCRRIFRLHVPRLRADVFCCAHVVRPRACHTLSCYFTCLKSLYADSRKKVFANLAVFLPL